jgi:hypothetical protein
MGSPGSKWITRRQPGSLQRLTFWPSARAPFAVGKDRDPDSLSLTACQVHAEED